MDYCINGYGSKTTNRIKQNYILVNILSDSDASAIHQCCQSSVTLLVVVVGVVESNPPLMLAVLMFPYQTFCVVEIHIAVEYSTAEMNVYCNVDRIWISPNSAANNISSGK